MTEDEFIFWEKAYLAALSGLSMRHEPLLKDAENASAAADRAVERWRAARAQVKSRSHEGPFR